MAGEAGRVELVVTSVGGGAASVYLIKVSPAISLVLPKASSTNISPISMAVTRSNLKYAYKILGSIHSGIKSCQDSKARNANYHRY
jgi:hypothetical protein